MNISVNSGEIEVRVDRRTELLGIIQIISDYRKKYPELLKKYGNKNYVEEIEKMFDKYKTNKVIKLFNEIIFNINFGYDAPVHLFLQLTDDFTFNNLSNYPFKERLNSDNRVIELLNLLPDFAKEIDFENFYTSNRSRYKKFVNNFKSQIDDTNIIEFMFNYYGIKSENKFIVNLIPFQTCGNYGTHNRNEIYSNICGLSETEYEEEIYPSFEQNSNIGYDSRLFHEFSHSFINPLTDKYFIIKEDGLIFSDIFEQMRKQAYGHNKTIISEHIIRALTIRRNFLLYKDMESYNNKIKKQKDLGFIYIENILESLVFYENNRDKYKNIDQFYPIIIKNIISDYENTKSKK